MGEDKRNEHMNKAFELLGLAGVGKSWLLRNNAYAPYRIEIIPKGWSFHKVANILVGVFLDTRLSSILLAVLTDRSLTAFGDRLRSVLLIFERLGRQWRGMRNSKNMIYDEGVTQAVWGLWWRCEFNEHNIHILSKLLARVVLHIGVVQYVTCSKKNHFARITSRYEKGGFDDYVRNFPELSLIVGRAWMARILWQIRKLNHKLILTIN